MNTAAATALAESVDGEVILPGDDAYDAHRDIFVHKGSPDVIVRCHGTEDVRRALAFARAEGLRVSVRSGGHSNAGLSTDNGGLVIDVSPLNGIDVVDAGRGLVRLGPGAQWGQVARALQEHGLSFSSGDTDQVGVGGLLLGGGIGWTVRSSGLALDNLVAAEVVTADGRVLRASADENADLFWGLRGGGGNFGVVTSFEVSARPLPRVHFGSITYPASEAASVVKGWARAMREAPEELTSHVQIFPSFGGDPAPVNILVCYAGEDATAASEAIAPLVELGTVASKDIALVAYPDVLDQAGELPPDWEPMVRNRFVRQCGDEFVDALLTGARAFDNLFVELRSLGGALNRVPADATAFAHRDAEVMLNTAKLGPRADNEAALPELSAFWAALAPFTDGAYSNFLSELDADDMAAVYPPETYARLQAVKDAYDPEDVFSRTPRVRPGTRA
ncbi:FAD-binding oxidoreductase [Streptomyces prasinosporus]|uniref:FAD-binding oxidoreductase n=1 Tax=Streptomyces prasinosporus TaxID=68256 RepID=A0ABP6TZ61_9ACTN